MTILALFGSPIKHSLSARLHAHFALQFGISIEYHLIEATLENFTSQFESFLQLGGQGGNFTTPLKPIAFKYIAQKTQRAMSANSVNTFYMKESVLFADNTDGAGLVQDLMKKNWPLKGARVLILGHGAVAQSIFNPLLQAQVASIDFGVRELNTQDILSVQENHKEIHIHKIRQAYDVIINATSASLMGTTIELHQDCYQNAYVYDVVYKRENTQFLVEAKAYGAHAISDGLGMLVEQGALGFEHWFDQKPDTKGVEEYLRNIIQL